MKAIIAIVSVGIFFCLNLAQAEKPLSCGEKYILDFVDLKIKPTITLNTIPFLITDNGDLTFLPGNDGRILSKEIKGNQQKIVYKQDVAEQASGQKNYKVRTVEQTALITRENGKIVSIKKINHDKSGLEVVYANDCEPQQKLVHAADPATQNPNVIYDKKLCDKIQSASNGISMKNLKICGEYIAKIEKEFTDRLSELAKEKKSLLGTSLKADAIGTTPLALDSSLFKIMGSCALGLGISSGGYLEFPQPQVPQKKPKDPRYYTPKAI